VLPELFVLFGPARDLLDAVRLELVDPLASFPSLAHQPRLAQHAQVS